MVNIQKVCIDCNGLGTLPASDVNGTLIQCGACAGEGVVPWGKLDIGLEEKFDSIDEKFDSLDIQLSSLESKVDGLIALLET